MVYSFLKLFRWDMKERLLIRTMSIIRIFCMIINHTLLMINDCFIIITNYWMRLSRTTDMKNSADWGGCYPPCSICGILHILEKPNSINILLLIQNIAKFKNKLKRANLGQCKIVLIVHLYFRMKVAGGFVHSNQGKFPAPACYWQA